MTRDRHLVSVLLLLSSIASSGCSTFAVRDLYQVAGDASSRAIEFKNEAVDLQVTFVPDMQFGSVGILGMPVIPIYIEIFDSSEVTLAANLVLRRDYPFSFLAAPCLSAEPQQTLCPYEVTIGSLGMFQDDGTMYKDGRKRWNHIDQFHAAGLSLKRPENGERVTQEAIYQHYGYTGVPKWEHLKVDLTYKYKCQGRCPDRFELNMESLAVVGNTPLLAGRYQLTKKREADYRFLTIVQ